MLWSTLSHLKSRLKHRPKYGILLFEFCFNLCYFLCCDPPPSGTLEASLHFPNLIKMSLSQAL